MNKGDAMSRVCYISTLEFVDEKEGYIRLIPQGIQFNATGTPVFYQFPNGVVGRIGSLVEETLTDNRGYARLVFQSDKEAKTLEKQFEDGKLKIGRVAAAIMEREGGLVKRWRIASVFLEPVVAK